MELGAVRIFVKECRAETHVTSNGTETDVYLTGRTNGTAERVVASDPDCLVAMRASFVKMLASLGVKPVQALDTASAKLLPKDDGKKRVWLRLGSHVEEGEHPVCPVSAAFAAYCRMLCFYGVTVVLDE